MKPLYIIIPLIIILFTLFIFKDKLFENYAQTENTKNISFFPSSVPSVTPYYNIFTPNLNPSIYDYTINYPPEFKTNASKAWLASKVKQCQSYNNNIVPQEPQDCPDSSFTFANNIARFVPTSSTNDLNYSGCIQLNVNSNYCYNDQFGNYLPNVEVLNHRSA